MPNDLKESVRSAARRPEVRATVADLYAAVQREIDQRKPLCVISGKCCRFEEYGHRLYVTTVELAAFVHSSPAMPSDWDGMGCPFQKNKLCSVHPIRPFGCRMFFCDPTSTEWQNHRYERFHADLKRIHEQFDVPYFYVEWRQALRECLSPSKDNL